MPDRPLTTAELTAMFDAIDDADLARQEHELRHEEATYRLGCPTHGAACEPDDHVEPPTVHGELI